MIDVNTLTAVACSGGGSEDHHVGLDLLIDGLERRRLAA
jgi:hypothetical protein